MAFATKSIDAVNLRNNAALISNAAAEFKVPTIVTTVAEKTFSGPIFDEIKNVFSKQKAIDRTTMNTWEDVNVIAEVNRIGRSRIVLAGLWTCVCIVGPALSALEQGFEVYVIADACGDVTDEAHERAVERMVQAGARPMTSLQYLLELQRDWARSETYNRYRAHGDRSRRQLRAGTHLRQDDVWRRAKRTLMRPSRCSCQPSHRTASKRRNREDDK